MNFSVEEKISPYIREKCLFLRIVKTNKKGIKGVFVPSFGLFVYNEKKLVDTKKGGDVRDLKNEDFLLKTNFLLAAKQKTTVYHIMHSLVSQAPVYSQIELNLYYENEGEFSGKLHIFSGKKSFYVTGEGPTVNSLVKNMYKKIQKQLMRWKKSRSRDEITGVFQLMSLSSEDDPESVKEAS